MSPHIDILDEHEPIGRSFVGAVLFHVLLVALVAGFTALKINGPTLGAEKGGHMGSVAITPVDKIPLPKPDAPPNPVAKDTPSNVPSPKAPPKVAPKPKERVKPPDPNSIPIPGGFTKRKYAEPPPDKFRAQEKTIDNQLTSHSGRQLSSDMFAMQGSGKMGLGENSPFGNQFGAYAEILRKLVAEKWKTSDIDQKIRTAPEVTVTFTLHRDGSVANVHITKSSGNAALDRSGQRAILDAAPFPKMPPAFPKDQTDIDFIFELKR